MDHIFFDIKTKRFMILKMMWSRTSDGMLESY
jgi:hypothetical protein